MLQGNPTAIVSPGLHPHLDPLFQRGRLPTVAPPKLLPPFRAAHPTTRPPTIYLDCDDQPEDSGARSSPLGPGTFPAGANAGAFMEPRPSRFSPRTDAAGAAGGPDAAAGTEDEHRVQTSDRTFGLPGSLATQ
eukprot:scaffold45262_cov21-Tisochrysis_lutea.AAC.2